jgi:LuxR family transcriptional regulator, maltose regulon positive regulatory protein
VGVWLNDELPPLVESKLAAPRQRSGMIRRRRVMEILDRGADAAVTLVAAPPGYGKTTAVRAWCAESNTALAWVSLDVGDNEPARLWTYLATAVDRVRQGLGRRALKRLRGTGVALDVVVDEVMNGIAEFGGPITLVLDDLHTVIDSECMASLDLAIAHLPANARLIVITRADPALDIPRLRACGDLAELRQSDLAFTTGEARELLVERGGLDLADEQVEVLLERTEGWPAALYMAVLWLRSVDDRDRAVMDFGGDHRYVAEYLGHEVLGALDDDREWFLLRIAVLGSFTSALCDAALGRSDSAEMLADLHESNMFVQGLERREWFRVHALFAQFAVARLAELDPAAPREIHQRAAHWLRSRGLIVEATEHAAAAEDHEFLAEMLSEYHLALIRNGRAGTLLRWVWTLPDAQIARHPDVALAAAVAATMVGRLTLQRRRLLALAERARVEHPEAFGQYEASVMAMARAAGMDDGVSDAVAHGHEAVQLAREGADEVLVAAYAALARACYFAGDLDGAWAAASRAAEHPRAAQRAPGYSVARATLALVAADRGHLTSARAHAETARAQVGKITSSRSWLGSIAAEAMAAVLSGEGDLAGAERELAYADRFHDDELATVQHAALLVRLADIRRRRGRLTEAESTLSLAREELAELDDSGTVPSAAQAAEHELEETRRRASGGEILERPSEAELAVLRLLATNLSARQIGEQLYLSPNTVRSHIRAIYRKLGVGSREEAVARANAVGLLGETYSPR